MAVYLRVNVLLDHLDEARAIALHVRSEEEQHVVGPNRQVCQIGTCTHMSESILLRVLFPLIYRARKSPLIAIKDRGLGPRKSTEVTVEN